MPRNGMTPHYSGSTLDAQARYAAGVRQILERSFRGWPLNRNDVILQASTPHRLQACMEIPTGCVHGSWRRARDVHTGCTAAHSRRGNAPPLPANALPRSAPSFLQDGVLNPTYDKSAMAEERTVLFNTGWQSEV
jgi:hypothetical protein